ncbi:MAG: M56 family metallopeptidase [Planctomycetota bacterium]|nr:M56 family metallopeptidase [Planctomycetota bacterium]
METFSYTENGKTVTILVPGDLPSETRKDWGQLALARNGLAGVPTNQVAKVACPSGQAEFDALDFLGYSLASIWAAGVVVFGCRSLVSYCRFAWHLYWLPSIEDQDAVDRLLRACDRIKFGRRPEIKEVASLNAPAVFGIVRPVICLPSRWRTQLSDTQFDLVLRHELAHLRRRDGLVLLFANIARSLHWWHPMSWVAYSRLQASMERAADEAATRGLSESNVRDYGNLLLQYANNNGTRPNRSLIVGLLAISPSITLRERIEALVTRTSKQRRFAGACTIPVIGLLACVGLTDAKPTAPTARPTDTPSPSFAASVDFF